MLVNFFLSCTGAIQKWRYCKTKREKICIPINMVWDIVGKRVTTYMLKWHDLHARGYSQAIMGDWSSVAMVS